ncbi:MAG: 23S rRNA (uracil(1939)-C(5))-methyltransferase RlmD [Oscillospiraceae bacterium]|nr:23S rRNA (uracil(1939)-C(5))-methyltransferase RlmD [Oscillospiraceae bacterium]
MKKNEELTLRVEGTTSEGLGVARHEGRAIFIKGAAEGELVRVSLTKVSASAVYGRLLEILEPSPHRTVPDCPYYGRCGGCDFRHVDYEEELRLKARRVRDALVRIGGLELESVSILGAERQEGYRNKVVYPVRQGPEGPEIGFFRSRTHEIIPVERCRIQNPAADAARTAVLAWMERYRIRGYDEQTRTGYVRSLLIRTADRTGQVLLCLSVNDAHLPRSRELVRDLQEAVPGLETVVMSIHKKPGNAVLGDRFETLFGPGFIVDELCGLRFRISAASFYQVNRDQAERLYALAAEAAGLTGTETLLDLYCGTGTIGLSMAARAKRVVGVEIVPQAVEDARDNAARNGITNAEFFCADAAQAAERFAQAGEKPDVVVVDPPRKGLEEAVIDAVAQMEPGRVVYVSCDPATLARDLKRFAERGYAVQSVHAADLFPRCAHVESVVLMSRAGS